MCFAAGRGHLDIVRLLVESGAAKDQATSDGPTPLCLASQGGHLDVVQLLVQVGAAKDHVTNDGYTPLLLALRLKKVILTLFASWLSQVPIVA